MQKQHKSHTNTDNWSVQMVSNGERLTAQELQDRASQVAQLLKSTGTKRVAFLTESRLECAELMLGARWAGADYLITGADKLRTGVRLSLKSLVDTLRDFEAEMVIISDAHYDEARWLLEELPNDTRCLMMGDVVKGWQSYELARDQQLSGVIESPEAGEFYPLSGGSTGRPKVIKTSVRMDGKPSQMQIIMTPGPDDTVLVAGPLYHGLHARALLASLLSGARAAILDQWDARMFLQTIEDYRVTHINIAPTTMVKLLQLPAAERERYDLSSLKQVLHTTAQCPDEVKRQFIDWFGERLIEVYTMTERFGGTSITSSEWLKHPGSVGQPFPDTRIIIRDANGKRLQAGEKGIIWFAQSYELTPMVYLGRPEDSAACYNEHGEATVNDIGYLDLDGFLYITGRAKRMVIVGGTNIYPEPTEKVLAGHPDVLDAWVFGRSDKTLGERLYAFIQLQPGATPTKQLASNLIALCGDKLGEYASPTQIIFVDDLPRNETGKMDAKQVAKLETAHMPKGTQ